MSLQNGFMIGMKVETPLRDADCDKYWLATIVAVYGPLLKLRYTHQSSQYLYYTTAACSKVLEGGKL